MEAGQTLVNGTQPATSIWSPIGSHISQTHYAQAYHQSQASISHAQLPTASDHSPATETDFLNNNLNSAQQSCIVSTTSRRSSQAETIRHSASKNGPHSEDANSPSAVQMTSTNSSPTPGNDDRGDRKPSIASPNRAMAEDSGPAANTERGAHDQSGSPLSVGSDQQSMDGSGFAERSRFLQQQDDQRHHFYDEHHQTRSTVIDYVNHHPQQSSHEQILANGGNLLFDLKNSEVFGHHQPLQGAFPYPGSADYFSTQGAAAGLTSLQTMATGAGGNIHSIFEYPATAAAAAAAMYHGQHHGHQQHVQYVDPQMAYYQPAYADQKLIAGGQYGAGWADATRPLTLQQYPANVAGGATGYFPPTPPITSPGNGQAYNRYTVEPGALRNWSGLPGSEGSAFLNPSYQAQGSGQLNVVPGSTDPLPHLEFVSLPPSATSPGSVTSPKECVQCATYDSPVWRRQESGHYLCQNCAYGSSNGIEHQSILDGGSGGAIVGSASSRGHSHKSQQSKSKGVSVFIFNLGGSLAVAVSCEVVKIENDRGR